MRIKARSIIVAQDDGESCRSKEEHLDEKSKQLDEGSQNEEQQKTRG